MLAFTMAQTPLPLDIVWFDAKGRPVDHTTMEPCEQGTDTSCPEYDSKQKYRYAARTAGGRRWRGELGAVRVMKTPDRSFPLSHPSCSVCSR